MITTSDKVDLIAPALISVLDKMVASKDGKNPHFRSDYMTLDGILNTVKPLLKEVDVGVLQSIETEDRTVKCNTHLLHVAVNTLTVLLQSTQTKTHLKGLVQQSHTLDDMVLLQH